MSYNNLPRELKILILLEICPADIHMQVGIKANTSIIKDMNFWKIKALHDLHLDESDQKFIDFWNLSSKTYKLKGYHRYVRTLAMFNIPTRDTDKVFNLDFCVKLAILHKNLHLLRHYCRNNTQLYEESILKLGAKYDSFNNNLVECVEYVLAGNSLLDDTGENKIHLGVQIAKGQTGKGFLYILSRKYTGLTFKEIIDVACNYGKFKLLREYMHKYASQNGSSTGLADYINQSKLEYYVKNNQKQKIIKLTQKIRKISKINGLSMCTDCEIIEWFYKYRPSALGIFALNLCSFEYCEPSLRYTPQINGCVIGQNPQYVYLFIKSGKVIKKMTDDKRYKTHPINRDFLSLLSK